MNPELEEKKAEVDAGTEVVRSRQHRQKKPMSAIKRRENLAGYAFVLPALLAFVLFILFPFIVSLLLSFTKWNFVSGLSGIEFVGFQNFTKLFSDSNFLGALKNTLIYVITTVPISIFIALVLAYLLNNRVYLKKPLRTAFFIPYICSVVALASVFIILFKSDGLVNNIITHLGGNAVNWLGTNKWARVPVIILLIYTSVGYEMIVYMAAIQNVPRELYESSTIDGAGGFKQFFKITFPLISPTTFYLMIIRIMGAFKTFSAVNALSNSTTNPNTASVVSNIYENAFMSYKFGYASAESLILFIILLAVTLFQFWGQKKWVHYDD